MDAVEKRARGLVMAEIPDLAQECFGYQGMTVVNLHVVMRILRAALTPPEGYVLVPVEPTEASVEAAAKALHAHGADSLCSDIPWDSLHQSEAEQFRGWAHAALLAARPEVL